MGVGNSTYRIYIKHVSTITYHINYWANLNLCIKCNHPTVFSTCIIYTFDQIYIKIKVKLIYLTFNLQGTSTSASNEAKGEVPNGSSKKITGKTKLTHNTAATIIQTAFRAHLVTILYQVHLFQIIVLFRLSKVILYKFWLWLFSVIIFLYNFIKHDKNVIYWQNFKFEFQLKRK